MTLSPEMTIALFGTSCDLVCQTKMTIMAMFAMPVLIIGLGLLMVHIITENPRPKRRRRPRR